MSLSVTYEPSLKEKWDWQEHRRSQFKRSPPLKLIAALAILGWILLSSGHTTAAWICLGLAVLLALSPALVRWQTNALRQRLAAMKLSRQTAHTLVLEKKGLRQIEQKLKRETLFYWETLKAITELEHLLVVELEHTLQPDSPQIAPVTLPLETFLIPRAAFASPEDCAAFLTELRGKMSVRETEKTPAGEP